MGVEGKGFILVNRFYERTFGEPEKAVTALTKMLSSLDASLQEHRDLKDMLKGGFGLNPHSPEKMFRAATLVALTNLEMKDIARDVGVTREELHRSWLKKDGFIFLMYVIRPAFSMFLMRVLCLLEKSKPEVHAERLEVVRQGLEKEILSFSPSAILDFFLELYWRGSDEALIYGASLLEKIYLGYTFRSRSERLDKQRFWKSIDEVTFLLCKSFMAVWMRKNVKEKVDDVDLLTFRLRYLEGSDYVKALINECQKSMCQPSEGENPKK